LDGRLSGCSPYPITSFNRDTPRLISECQSFEKSYGFLNMVSGHQVVWLHHFEKLRQVPECRCGSTGCIGVHRWGQWSLVGWVYGGLGLHLGGVGDDGGSEGKQKKNGCSRARTSKLKCCCGNYRPRYFSKNSFNLRMTDVFL
jgi:hypothetical protein